MLADDSGRTRAHVESRNPELADPQLSSRCGGSRLFPAASSLPFRSGEQGAVQSLLTETPPS